MRWWKILVGYFIAILIGGFLDEFLRGIIPQTSDGKIWVFMIWLWSLFDFWIAILCAIIWTIIWMTRR